MYKLKFQNLLYAQTSHLTIGFELERVYFVSEIKKNKVRFMHILVLIRCDTNQPTMIDIS